LASHNLLVLSDVHLGSDLVNHVQPGAPRQASSDRRDQELAGLFDWYREHRQEARPWRLVIAGDFVDFVGMSISMPSSGLGTEPDEDDVTNGLGSAEDHTIYKLRCVAQRHGSVFDSLARFVADGNTLVIVRGNHDVDFHWPAVQEEFVRQLESHASFARGAVEFAPWFYYEEGRVFVEHGHQYDRYCSYEHLLHPVSPRDPRRSSRSLSDILLRHVVRPTRGLLETGHESAGPLDYVVFAARLGVLGMLMLANRFARAVAMLFRIWRDHSSDAARRIGEHHERRMEELARSLDLRIDSLRELSSLQRPPVTRSFAALAATVMLDRVLLALVGTVTVVAAVCFASRWHALGVAGGVFVVVPAVSLLLSFARRDIEPSRELRERAAYVARLFPAAFVVMGHTHLPEVRPTGGAASTYVNLGAWADGGGDESALGTKTHLVVHERDDGRPIAELLVWDGATGPRRFLSAVDPAPIS
jgi:UDP-2,3-diacylglucosamine pyrophosphatase LpxH